LKDITTKPNTAVAKLNANIVSPELMVVVVELALANDASG